MRGSWRVVGYFIKGGPDYLNAVTPRPCRVDAADLAAKAQRRQATRQRLCVMRLGGGIPDWIEWIYGEDEEGGTSERPEEARGPVPPVRRISTAAGDARQ